jgi:4'-phosphopantetheinyl transferase
MSATEKLWSCTPTDSRLLPRDLQVWAAWLDVTGEGPTKFWSTLSNQERERAARFASDRERARFVVARGLLRAILGSSLGADPQSLAFLYSAKGKPSLGGAFATSGLQFNLAHSGGLAVFAIARDRMVGVDVEQLRPVPELSSVIARFFAPRECAEIKKLSGAKELRAFFQIWTRKEACLKATGEGITGLPGMIEVLGPSGTERTCGGAQDGSPGPRLRLHDLAPAPGFVGALAVTPQ